MTSVIAGELDTARVTLLFFTGIAAVAVSLPFVIRAMVRLDVNDRPNERSSHTNTTPRGGGIAILIGTLVALGTIVDRITTGVLAVTVGALAFAALGLLDDLKDDLSPLIRLAMQLAIAVVTAFAIAAIADAAQVITLLLVVVGPVVIAGFVNAFNFMDGINGISSATVIAVSVSYSAIGVIESDQDLVALAALSAAVALGFMPFNAGVARIFLGDVGSYFFGAWLILMAVVAFARGTSALALGAPLLLYVADTATTILRRVRRGESWKEAHREHAYQRLNDVGLSHQQAAAAVGGTTLVCGLLGTLTLLASLPAQIALAAAAATIVTCYLLLPGWLASRTRRTL